MPATPFAATDVAHRFLRALEAMDITAALACFADHGIQEMPFAPPGFPSRLNGIAELRRQYSGLPDAYTSMSFQVHSEHTLTDPTWALLEYHGSITKRDGDRYDNDYAGVFHVIDHHIVLFREYFNPLILQQSFAGGAMAEAFSLAPDRNG